MVFCCSLSIAEYVKKFDSPENEDVLEGCKQWVNKKKPVKGRNPKKSKGSKKLNCTDSGEETDDNERLLSPTPDNDDPEATAVQEDLLDNLLNDDSNDSHNEKDSTSSRTEHNTSDSIGPMRLVDETDTASETGSDIKSLKRSKKHNKSKIIDNDEVSYAKPPLSAELLIAIAVRNLDPFKETGASCNDIVAFLSIHFPYFKDHHEECKVSIHLYFAKFRQKLSIFS